MEALMDAVKKALATGAAAFALIVGAAETGISDTLADVSVVVAAALALGTGIVIAAAAAINEARK
jgi:hypothetical protein